jgi:hypothetical protein
MNRNAVDKPERTEIMTPEETARYLRKSLSWVYKHWQILGGVKLGGSILFPSQEELHERIFSKGEGVEVRLHPEGDQAPRPGSKPKKRQGRQRQERGRS